MRFNHIFALLFVSVTALQARAASITWENAHDITGDDDVSTEGALDFAYSFGGIGVPAVTVNTVPFESFPVPGGTTYVTLDSLTIGQAGESLSNVLEGFSDYGSINAPFSNLSSEYQSLLGSVAAKRSEAEAAAL